MSLKKSLKSSIENLNQKSINNYILPHFTYLNWAIYEKDVSSIRKLLKEGINPNGVSSIGLSPSIPLTLLDFKWEEFKPLCKTLLRYGADINGEDLQGRTILTKCVDFFLSDTNCLDKDFLTLFTFLLEKGSNPDGTIFHNPLQKIVKTIKDIPKEGQDILFYLTELFLSFGANPKMMTKLFIPLSNDKNSSSYSSLEMYPENSSIYKRFHYLFNLTTEKIIQDCNSDIIIESLAKYFKISPIHTSKNQICKCIKTISQSKKDYSEDLFVEIRQNMRRDGIQCSNEDLLIGANVNSFTDNEIIHLHETNPDITYCFHVSEIPILLSSRKNPFNNKPLHEDFVNSLVEKYKYFPAKTLEEALDDLFIFKETRIDSNVLLNKLSEYIRTFNSYIQPEKIMELKVPDLVEIQNMLFEGRRDLINSSTLPEDRIPLRGETTKQTIQRIRDRTISHIFLRIQNVNGSLPLIANIIDQLLKDSSCAREILYLFPKKRIETIKSYIAGGINFDEFKRNVVNKVIYDKDYLSIINDKNFLNYLTPDENEVIQFIERRDLIQIYNRYIMSSLEFILQTRFGDMSIRQGWMDIVPSMIRVVVD
jgi:hypothetical protein